jgi:ABC-type amino acid transport substrate-binding protein
MKKFIVVALILILSLAFAACGDKGASDDVTRGNNASSVSEPKTLKVGLGIPIPKIQYLDEDGNWQGYDYEILVRIDELLPQYQFEYEAIADFPAAFTGLDTKKYAFLSIHASWAKEREEKYLYGTASFFEDTGYNLVVKKGSDITVDSIENLAGLKISVPQGVSYQTVIEQFNQENPGNPIEIVVFNGSQEQVLADLQSGAIDGTVGSPFSNMLLKESYGDVFDEKGENLFYDPAKNNGTYFLFRYGDERLRDDIDSALNKLLADGTISALSEEIFGVDVTEKPVVSQ